LKLALSHQEPTLLLPYERSLSLCSNFRDYVLIFNDESFTKLREILTRDFERKGAANCKKTSRLILRNDFLKGNKLLRLCRCFWNTDKKNSL